MDIKNTNETALEDSVKILVAGKYQLDFELARLSKIYRSYKTTEINKSTKLNTIKKLSKKLAFRIAQDCKGLSLLKNEHFNDKLYTTSITPFTFIKFVLPFSNPNYPLYGDSGNIETIDPFLVVGGTFNVYEPNNESVFEKTEILNRLADKPVSDGQRNLQMARYCKIGDLPLYVAYEGKNRVLMYQKIKKPIRAIVRPTEFPKPEELALYPIQPFNLYAVSCSNPKFYKNNSYHMSILPFHELVLPMLTSYGVRINKPVFSIRSISIWRTTRKYITSNLLGGFLAS